MTPSERTLAYYRKLGYTVGRVERDVRIPPQFKGDKPKQFKQDLFGFLDYIAIKPGSIIGIQSTVATEKQRHIDKIQNEPRAHIWAKSGALLHLLCWRTLAGKWIPIIVLFGSDMKTTEMPNGFNGRGEL